MEKLQKALKKARENRDSMEAARKPSSKDAPHARAPQTQAERQTNMAAPSESFVASPPAPSASAASAPVPPAPVPPAPASTSMPVSAPVSPNVAPNVASSVAPSAVPPNLAASVAATGGTPAVSEPLPRGKPISSGRRRTRLDGVSEKVMDDFPHIWEKLTPYEPNPELLLKNRIMTLNAQVAANPFDVLRTKVFLLMRQNGWKRVAITSPTASCGKTTTACNLGVGFSRQREIKSMLFDFDLRKPSVARMLGRKPDYSVIDLLNDEVSAQQQMLRLRSNVALSMSRGPVTDPTQVLLSQATGDMFHVIEGQFDPDVMIFDLPPMLVTDDARAFLKNVDCALIVARAEQTKMSQLDICEREVSEHTNVLGVVLNDCRHVSDEEQYYGEYA